MAAVRRSGAAPSQTLAKAVEASKAPAISRAAAVLRLLGQSHTPLGVHAIARELGLVPSTCFHVLRALVAEELVAFDPDTKHYALGAGVLSLSRQWQRQNRFSGAAGPLLEGLSQTFEVTALGVQIIGMDHMMVVAVAQSASNIQLSMQVGSRFPALTSATGRCVAAFGGFSDEDLAARYASVQWDSPLSYEDWKAQVDRTAAQGFAVDPGNYIAGMTVVAAPVWETPGRMSHAIVAIGFSSALERGGLQDLVQAVQAAAQALSGR